MRTITFFVLLTPGLFMPALRAQTSSSPAASRTSSVPNVEVPIQAKGGSTSRRPMGVCMPGRLIVEGVPTA
jgi:hypothetical protein